jgi:co-chaperonin GroES (HSP10)
MTCDLIPMEFNVVVELDPVEEKTAGGLYLPTSKVDRDKLEAEEGTLVAVSPHAFTYAEWPDDARKPQVGDRVLIARFAGVLRERNGVSLKIVKDKDIIAVVAFDHENGIPLSVSHPELKGKVGIEQPEDLVEKYRQMHTQASRMIPASAR